MHFLRNIIDTLNITKIFYLYVVLLYDSVLITAFIFLLQVCLFPFSNTAKLFISNVSKGFISHTKHNAK